MFIAVRTGLEPVTPCVTGMYSNQLKFVLLLSLSIAVQRYYKIRNYQIFEDYF